MKYSQLLIFWFAKIILAKYLNAADLRKSILIFENKASGIVFVQFISESKSLQKLIPEGSYTMLYVGRFFKMLKEHTRALGFNDICKHSGKFQLFNMCGSQNILKV